MVEIDECMLVRRKYHRGHMVRHQWIFGAIDIGTKEGIMIPVACRDAATLLPIIQQHILPGKLNVHTVKPFLVVVFQMSPTNGPHPAH